MKRRTTKKLVHRWLRTKKDIPRNRMAQIGLTARQRRAVTARERYMAWFRGCVNNSDAGKLLSDISAIVAGDQGAWPVPPRLPWDTMPVQTSRGVVYTQVIV